MLSLQESFGRLGRRDFLKVGGLSIGGMALPSWWANPSLASQASHLVSGKSVVFVFMHGGPSQTETFDPKMSAPSNIRSQTGEIDTRIPGVTFGGTFPKLAALAHRLAIVRSFVTGDGNHDIKPIVGRESFGANLGSVYARIAGVNHPQTGIPTNVTLFPRAVDESTQAPVTAFGKWDATGSLGAAYSPFDPSGGGDLKQDMKLEIPLDRLDDRRALLVKLDQARRGLGLDPIREDLDRTRDQAFGTIVGGVAEAFDLSREDPATIERYDTAPLVRPDQIDRKWNNYNNYVDNAKSLGKLMLMARRLCERGCGFVTVTTNFVWDMHSDVNNAGVAEGMRYMGHPFDHAVSAFVEDIYARGLDDKVLLVACGEMGRTPQVDANGGRNHWGNLAPLLLSGGGLNVGQVIGQSSRNVGEPASEPMTIQRLVATILHSLVDVGELRVTRNMPRDVTQTMTGWNPIPGLL